jgi:hypothetical protein
MTEAGGWHQEIVILRSGAKRRLEGRIGRYLSLPQDANRPHHPAE